MCLDTAQRFIKGSGIDPFTFPQSGVGRGKLESPTLQMELEKREVGLLGTWLDS